MWKVDVTKYAEIRINLPEWREDKKYGEGLEQLMIQTTTSVKSSVEVWCMSTHGFQWHWVTGV